MKYVAAILGAFAALSLANWLWYPAPDVHGVALGLLLAAIALTGAVAASGVVWLLGRVT